MKTNKLSLIAAILTLALSSSSVLAAPKKKLTKESDINNSSSNTSSTRTNWSASYTESGSSNNIGVGLSDAGSLLMGSSYSPSVMFHLGEKSSIQALFTIATTSPFNFGVGGIYRCSVTGNRSAGFHVGGGFGIGTTTAAEALYVTIAGVLGFHFTPWNAIGVSLDFGPGITFGDVETNFGLKGIGASSLSASVHYYL